MDWEAAGAIGEILGAMGVIVTLAYLASQIRQNTRAMHSQSAQSLAEAGAAMNAMIIEDADVARIFRTGLSKYQELSGDDRLRFRFLIGQWMLAYESVYVQHKLGTIDRQIFDARMNNLRLWLSTEGGSRAWEVGKEVFSQEYVKYVEQNVLQ